MLGVYRQPHKAVGIDLALRHGAAVLLEIIPANDGRPVVTSSSVLVEWGKKKPNEGIGVKTPESTAALWATQTLRSVLAVPGDFPVAFDWTRYEGFMGRRDAAILKAFVVGVMATLCTTHGKIPLYIGSPAIRKLLRLKANQKGKQPVWDSYTQMVKHDPSTGLLWASEHLPEDVRDSWVLAWAAWYALEEVLDADD